MATRTTETPAYNQCKVNPPSEVVGFPEPIAIVGMACRLPQGVSSPSEFWTLLEEGRSTTTEVPSNRFNVHAFRTTAKVGHFLSGDLGVFDASFFGVPKHEAEALDPQQRGLLECTYHALENSGIAMEAVAGSKTGVFVGCMGREYDWTLARDPESQHQYQAIGSGSAMLSNRLSWFYDFRGPSITIDTACSSSLVALHLACQSLQAGDSDMTVVGGANLIINPDNMIAMSSLNFLSPDGHCYSFDHRANGYSRGEGFGVLILKRLSQAIQENNTIRTIIRATHCNQDGKTPGITNPSKNAQVALVKEAYSKAGLCLEDTRLFEAHGTGTQAGDTTEAAAIQEVFGGVRTTEDPIVVGALKSIIGHLEGASGVASVIKTILALEKGIIPPNANFEKANPQIPVDEWCLRFPVAAQPWPSSGLRRASLNSFGYGGSNAHAILDDAYHYMKQNDLKYKHNTNFHNSKQSSTNGTCTIPVGRPMDPGPTNGTTLHKQGSSASSLKRTREISKPRSPMKRPKSDHIRTEGLNGIERRESFGGILVDKKQLLWALSTFDELSMQKLVNSLEKVCETAPMPATKAFATDMAYTLASRRSKLPCKSFCIVDEELDYLPDLSVAFSPPVRTGDRAPKVTYVFTGQGAAWWDMGKELFHEKIYRDSITASNHILRTMGCAWDLIEELTRGEKYSRILDAQISQPATTALQIALVDLLRSWNISPSAVVGHSSGEIAAAYCAGALSHRAALQVSFYRGKLSAELYHDWSGPAETMMVVALSLMEVEDLISLYKGEGFMCVACINSPNHVTIAGSAVALATLRGELDAKGTFAKELRVDVAYHSPTMERISEKYLADLEGLSNLNDAITTQPIPFFSSVTGKQVPIQELQRGTYWVTNMVSKVQFSAALLATRESTGVRTQGWYVEIGPTNALRRPILETLGDVLYGPCLGCEISAYKTMFTLAGNLWSHNVPVDLVALNGIDTSRTNMLPDLPLYPFNHEPRSRYWHESRMNKNIRFRKHPRCDILGSQDLSFNRLEAKWTNTIRIRELPWLEDHKINGSVLFPASGMVFMAVEAARQLVFGCAASISGFRIKDLRISRALIFPLDINSVETETYLHDESASGGTRSWSFRVCGLENDQWMEACRGTVTVEFENENGDSDEREIAWAQQARLREHEGTALKCGHTVLEKHMYDNLARYGYSYGSNFRALSQIHFSQHGQAAANVDVAPWKTRPQVGRQHIIHPIPLDAMFQLPLVAVSKGSWQAIPTMIPNGVRNLWLSNRLMEEEYKTVFLTTKSVKTGKRDFDFTITASANGELLATFDGYHGTAISTLKPFESSDWRRICFQESWKLDVSSASPQSLAIHCNANAMALMRPADAYVENSELLCLYFMSKSLEAADETCPKQPHLRKYTEWLKYYLKTEDAQGLLEGYLGSKRMNEFFCDSSTREKSFANMEESGPEGKVYTTVGRNLPGIIRGEVDAIDLLFGGDLLQRFYSGPSFLANYERMSAYLELKAHKTPDMTILEIGAGTGGATAAIMKAIGQDPQDAHSTPKYHVYDYTDISPGFFEAAKERFHKFSDRMAFKTLDIETEPSDQGFNLETYDVIIASCVLHATSNISNTLMNTRSLLKPGGKLILFEPTEPACARLPFVFGLLEGWWLATEESRRWSPLLTDADWDVALRKNGFSGADLCLKDFDDRSHTFSVIVSTAVDSVTPTPIDPDNGVIFIDPSSSIQRSIAEAIQRYEAWEMLPLQAMENDMSGIRTSILLFELRNSVLHRLDPEEFSLLKKGLNKMRKAVWVTEDSTVDPLAGVTTGFARSISSEIDTLTLTTLTLQNVKDASVAAERILKLCHTPENELEQEYVERNGELHINRVVECNFVSDYIFHLTVPQPPSKTSLGSNRDRVLSLPPEHDRLHSELYFIEDPDEGLLEGEAIEVTVEAVGIHPGSNGIISHQCAGVVSRVGNTCPTDKFQIGDRVCCLARNGFKTIVRSHESIIQGMPSTMSFEEAASIPVPWCTAYYSLIHLAQLRQGETVLIHNATTAIGSAALQLAKWKGAKIIATVGYEEERSWLIRKYGLEESSILCSRNQGLEHGVRRITEGQGVDVVLGSVSSDFPGPSKEHLASFGRFIDISREAIYDRKDCFPISANNVSIFRVNLLDMLEKAKKLTQNIFKEVMKAYRACQSQGVSPSVKTFTASQLEDAVRCLGAENISGSVVVRLRDEDTIPVALSTKVAWKFDPDATYVIAGGTGGLGRSIARWMMGRGAMHILILGRSGTQSETVATLITEAKQMGVEVRAPKCDVTILEKVEEVMQHCSKSMPPVRGCIQASMILRDSLLQNMDHEMFKSVLEPKVRGTINLRKTMPRDMDFFLLLSSTTGIFGSRGQSNYAGSSTFQNAFARYLAAHGQKCLSVDLGLMLGVGYAAERQHITDSLRAAGYDGISESEFHALLEWSCDPELELTAEGAHIITGISTPASIAAKGLDEIFWMRKPIFRGLLEMDRTESTQLAAPKETVDYRTMVQHASDTNEAGEIIAIGLVEKLSKALGMPASDFDVARPIHTYGVDSLVAVEIRYWCKKEFEADIAVFEILQSKRLEELCLTVATKSGLRDPANEATKTVALHQ